MNWQEFNSIDQIKNPDGFIVWDKLNSCWYTCYSVDGAVIGCIDDFHKEIPLENISHFCIPKSPFYIDPIVDINHSFFTLGVTVEEAFENFHKWHDLGK